jgi:uracil-DNA glycosylase
LFEEGSDLNELYPSRKISQCICCNKLVATRNTIVQGFGDTKAKIMFVGESPDRLGADITVAVTKDRSGRILFQIILMKLGPSL